MKVKIKDYGEPITITRKGKEIDEIYDCICSACGETFHEDEIEYINEPYEYWGGVYTKQYAVSPCCGEAYYTDDDIENYLYDLAKTNKEDYYERSDCSNKAVAGYRTASRNGKATTGRKG